MAERKKNLYLGAERIHQREKEWVDCEHCVYEYNCPCIWSWLSETCVKIQKEVRYETDSTG